MRCGSHGRWVSSWNERNNSALKTKWNPVDYVRVFEVPKGTGYVQGVVSAQDEIVAGMLKHYPGGGPQVVINESARRNLTEIFIIKVEK